MSVWPFLVVWFILTVVSLLYLAIRPGVTSGAVGKAFAFLWIFLAPILALLGGASAHLERSKSTEFCLSCHVMEPYGKSLLVDDGEYLAAQHYQNNRVPRDHACYACHTDYVMFGGVRAKLRGLRHVFVNYFATVPDTIRLYSPFNSRECLHCHRGSRSFEESSGHRDEETPLDAIRAGRVSCLEAGCHDVAHNVHELSDVTYWKSIAAEASLR